MGLADEVTVPEQPPGFHGPPTGPQFTNPSLDPGGGSATAFRHQFAETVDGLLMTLGLQLTPRPMLSYSAAATLTTLARHGPLRLTELSAREGITQPAMTQLVARLERDRLVCRSRDSADGRVVNVSITAAGRALLDDRRRQRTEALTDLLAGLPPQDEAVLEAALPVLRRLANQVRPRAATD